MGYREFRSDTMTRPSQAMRQAMAAAEVGDDVCGEDPTVHRLEEMAAALLRMEAALFVPSGVFANQCAIGVHCQPGEEIIVSESAHVVAHESGAAALLSGVQLRAVVPARERYLTPQDVEPRIRVGEDVHHPRTRLIILENALSDGTVMPVEAMAEMARVADNHRVSIHLDGARVFNAALALDVAPCELSRHADSVSFCLSKGLGAPIGSLLCGAKEFIHRARRRRKAMGGGMRQVGVLAAPGLLALEEGRRRLGEDHRRARDLAVGLAALPCVRVDLDAVQTNMVYAHLDHPTLSETDLVERLWRRDIRVYPPLPEGIRFVLSSEVGDEDVAAVIEAVRGILRR